jgi:hypothetical protein
MVARHLGEVQATEGEDDQGKKSKQSIQHDRGHRPAITTGPVAVICAAGAAADGRRKKVVEERRYQIRVQQAQERQRGS